MKGTRYNIALLVQSRENTRYVTCKEDRNQGKENRESERWREERRDCWEGYRRERYREGD